jgi:hypothetical protein
MRKLLICGLFFGAFAALIAVPADAAPGYRGGWCLVANLGVGFVKEDCSFRSFEACRAQQYTFGSTSFCRVSGYAVPGYRAGDEPRRVKKRRKSQNY